MSPNILTVIEMPLPKPSVIHADSNEAGRNSESAAKPNEMAIVCLKACRSRAFMTGAMTPVK
jgi:hypothetical protein